MLKLLRYLVVIFRLLQERKKLVHSFKAVTQAELDVFVDTYYSNLAEQAMAYISAYFGAGGPAESVEVTGVEKRVSPAPTGEGDVEVKLVFFFDDSITDAVWKAFTDLYYTNLGEQGQAYASAHFGAGGVAESVESTGTQKRVSTIPA